MNKLYVITGPAGVGKSTISRGIADKLEKSCLIEGDDVYHLVKGGYVSPWLEGNHLDLFWENSLSLIKNSLSRGYDVVFNYILDKDDVKRIKKQFENIDIKFVVLMVDEKTIVERDNLREEDCRMGERSLILLQEMIDENFDLNNVLDTSSLTIDDTINIIISNDRFII